MASRDDGRSTQRRDSSTDYDYYYDYQYHHHYHNRGANHNAWAREDYHHCYHPTNYSHDQHRRGISPERFYATNRNDNYRYHHHHDDRNTYASLYADGRHHQYPHYPYDAAAAYSSSHDYPSTRHRRHDRRRRSNSSSNHHHHHSSSSNKNNNDAPLSKNHRTQWTHENPPPPPPPPRRDENASSHQSNHHSRRGDQDDDDDDDVETNHPKPPNPCPSSSGKQSATTTTTAPAASATTNSVPPPASARNASSSSSRWGPPHRPPPPPPQDSTPGTIPPPPPPPLPPSIPPPPPPRSIPNQQEEEPPSNQPPENKPSAVPHRLQNPLPTPRSTRNRAAAALQAPSTKTKTTGVVVPLSNSSNNMHKRRLHDGGVSSSVEDHHRPLKLQRCAAPPQVPPPPPSPPERFYTTIVRTKPSNQSHAAAPNPSRPKQIALDQPEAPTTTPTMVAAAAEEQGDTRTTESSTRHCLTAEPLSSTATTREDDNSDPSNEMEARVMTFTTMAPSTVNTTGTIVHVEETPSQVDNDEANQVLESQLPPREKDDTILAMNLVRNKHERNAKGLLEEEMEISSDDDPDDSWNKSPRDDDLGPLPRVVPNLSAAPATTNLNVSPLMDDNAGILKDSTLTELEVIDHASAPDSNQDDDDKATSKVAVVSSAGTTLPCELSRAGDVDKDATQSMEIASTVMDLVVATTLDTTIDPKAALERARAKLKMAQERQQDLMVVDEYKANGGTASGSTASRKTHYPPQHNVQTATSLLPPISALLKGQGVVIRDIFNLGPIELIRHKDTFDATKELERCREVEPRDDSSMTPSATSSEVHPPNSLPVNAVLQNLKVLRKRLEMRQQTKKLKKAKTMTEDRDQPMLEDTSKSLVKTDEASANQVLERSDAIEAEVSKACRGHGDEMIAENGEEMTSNSAAIATKLQSPPWLWSRSDMMKHRQNVERQKQRRQAQLLQRQANISRLKQLKSKQEQVLAQQYYHVQENQAQLAILQSSITRDEQDIMDLEQAEQICQTRRRIIEDRMSETALTLIKARKQIQMLRCALE